MNDNERSIAPRAPSVYDKAADGRSLLHKNPVVARPVNDDERSIGLNTPVQKEDEEGPDQRFPDGDASADEVDDDKVRV